MSKQTFGSSHVPLSLAVRAGDFIFITGQTPVGSNGENVGGTIEVQTCQVLENVKAALALAGADMSDVVKTNAWLKDARDFVGFNKVYAT
jgi:2-iminobutanoate/2-iminopropanoate deaminase